MSNRPQLLLGTVLCYFQKDQRTKKQKWSQ